MTKEEILHLASLSRISLTDSEVEKFKEEIDSILSYVSAIDDIVADGDLIKKTGAVHNVFREDEITNEPGYCTEELTEAFPYRQDNYLKVKKILDTES